VLQCIEKKENEQKRRVRRGGGKRVRERGKKKWKARRGGVKKLRVRQDVY